MCAKVVNPLQSQEARGKMGGLIFNTTRGIQYAKAFTAPSQPRTAAQVNVRALMTSASREWKSLTQIQRDSWATYADAHPVPDWTGSMIRLTGMNAYIRLNMQSRQAGGVQIMTPPAAAAPAVPAALTAAINATNLQATWTGALPAAVKLDVWLVGPVSTGANPRREKAVHKVFSAAAGDTPLQIIAACPAGRYGVWMRTVDTATGLTSAETKVVVDVV